MIRTVFCLCCECVYCVLCVCWVGLRRAVPRRVMSWCAVLCWVGAYRVVWCCVILRCVVHVTCFVVSVESDVLCGTCCALSVVGCVMHRLR